MTKSVALLFSSRSLGYITSRHIRSRFLHHGYPYATKAQQQLITTALFQQGRRYSTAPEKKSDPLHILFCGSDEFSCASLKALYNEHVQNPDLIRSIDVVVRPGKRTGRGYKIVRDPPIRSLAESLGLPIHERDTFTGWNMPSTTNLIIAVSFGLFVPPRLLRAARYGGLNVHPSLLPDLRGPAPLQHTLLAGRALTGVSLQTLDPAAFDHGVVLAQTPAGLGLRVPPTCRSVPQLQALVTPVAATMLVAGLRAGLHVPPLVDVGWRPDPAAPLVHAPKIAKRDRRLSRKLLDAEVESEAGAPGALARRQDAIGPLWFESRDRHGRKKRVIVEALEELAPRGVSPVDRPRMIEELPALSTTPSSTPLPSSAATAPRTTAVQRDPTPGYREYAIPFEEECEPDDSPQDHAPQSPIPRLNLVFWDSDDASAAGAPDSLCLGNYRVLSLKVEGDRAKPARLALQSFFIDSRSLSGASNVDKTG